MKELGGVAWQGGNPTSTMHPSTGFRTKIREAVGVAQRDFHFESVDGERPPGFGKVRKLQLSAGDVATPGRGIAQLCVRLSSGYSRHAFSKDPFRCRLLREVPGAQI